jgi:hypothetical protein
MFFKEIIVVYSENHTKYINRPLLQITELLNAKVNGIPILTPMN